MMKNISLKLLLFFIGVSLIYSNSYSQITTKSKIETITIKTITLPSKDGLLITADYYKVEPSKNFALLCHQAGFSRGEYRETAPKLAYGGFSPQNYSGFSSLAIDQRSGNKVNGIINETAKRAKEKGLPTDYLDAKQDIEAAIDLAYAKNNNKPILLVGSSYSASLALLIGKNNNKVKAIAVFSPGEYLKGIDLANEIKDLNKPVFVTSAKDEIPSVKKLLRNVNPEFITLFEPKVSGFHGSKALWFSKEGHQEYWKAFNLWLTKHFTTH